MGKLVDLFELCEIKITSWHIRIILIVMGTIILLSSILVPVTITNDNYKEESKTDSNVYLNEEVCFAKEIYLKVVGLSEEDEDDRYVLKLSVAIEQRCNDGNFDKIKLSPHNFKLKSVNIKSKSNMIVFFGCLYKASVIAALGAGLSGSVNIIEETLNFATEYTLESIKNAETNKSKFKPVKAQSDSFDTFYPYKTTKITILLRFSVPKSQLDTNDVIVLTIDQLTHIERKVFLTMRPTN